MYFVATKTKKWKGLYIIRVKSKNENAPHPIKEKCLKYFSLTGKFMYTFFATLVTFVVVLFAQQYSGE